MDLNIENPEVELALLESLLARQTDVLTRMDALALEDTILSWCIGDLQKFHAIVNGNIVRRA